MISTIDKETILKFDTPGPRYTSYPTAPEWNNDVGALTYQEKLKSFSQSPKTLSLYVHIPFCQSMCYYCACNVVIRRMDEKYGDEYIDYLSKEIDLVTRVIGRTKDLKQLHWGGGTPTFLNERQIERLFKKIRQSFNLDKNGEIAIEIDPRTIDQSKVKKLRELGFNRVSMGVQDFDREVQRQVNRVQPFEIVKDFYDWCRELKFESVNFDLIYGLPGQTKVLFKDTVKKVIALKPDRVALYSFAYVPWLKKHQTKLHEEDFPQSDEKLDIFLQARAQFLSGGYQAIAMDHFALSQDEMAKAFQEGKLYRNFMGYTVKPADEYIGLGLTAIGFLENTYIQNHKTLAEYYGSLKDNELPIERGKVLTFDDQIRQWVISRLMCHFELSKSEFTKKFEVDFDVYFAQEEAHMDYCLKEGLISFVEKGIRVTDLGKIFIRNVCMGFDWYLRQNKAERRFSRTV